MEWQCHICGEEFSAEQGAVCSRCRLPACGEHLRLAGYNERDGLPARPEQVVCTGCLKTEAHVPFERRLFIPNPLGRVLGA